MRHGEIQIVTMETDNAGIFSLYGTVTPKQLHFYDSFRGKDRWPYHLFMESLRGNGGKYAGVILGWVEYQMARTDTAVLLGYCA